MFHVSDSKSPPNPRTQRACDQCRQRKARCDGLGMTDRKCSGCVSTGRECTYTNFKRKSAKISRKPTPEYVEELEKTIEQMRELLVTVKPDMDVLSELGPTAESNSVTLTHFSKDFLTACLRNIHTSSASTAHQSDDEEDTYVPVEGGEGIIFGMSSNAHLAKELVNLKNEAGKNQHAFNIGELPVLEPEIWMPGEVMSEAFLNADMPDYETLAKLVKVYFERVNIFWPFLHQPTIERQLLQGDHLKQPMAGGKILMIAAIASQYADDFETYWNITNTRESLAWKWFYLGQRLRKSTAVSLPSIPLDELQFHCLMTFFLAGHQLGHAGWVLCGAGLRIVQCAGSQKRSRYIHMPPLESELTKRVVWTFTNIDILWSAALGRPPMHVLVDLGPSIECDDEYCQESNSPEEAFKHPPDRPSKIAFFNRMVPLMQILSFVLNTVYSTKYLKTHLSSNVPEFNQHLVRELDSAMNKWMEAMPAHLKWDPHNEDDIFFSQSALLHCIFYLVQILIHRPFIPSSNKPSTIPLPSLSICLNAARACCRIAEDYVKRVGFVTPNMQFAVFTAALIILMSVYSKKKSSPNANTAKDFADVKRCIHIIEGSGDRWPSTRRSIQALKDLASIGPEPAETSSSSSSSQATPPNQPVLDLNVDELLAQTWESPTAWDNLFSNFNPVMNDPGSQYNMGAVPPFINDTTFAPTLPYEALWQDTGMLPMNGMGEIFAGLQPMPDGLVTDYPQKQNGDYPTHFASL